MSSNADLSGSIDSLLSLPLPHAVAGLVKSYIEVWDYLSGARFRGFVAERNGQRALFVFYDRHAFGDNLKPGYGWAVHILCGFDRLTFCRLLALLELCNVPEVDCSEFVICLDRGLRPNESREIVKDFGWVGFTLTTLADWTDQGDIISERWVFLSMET